MTRETDEFEIKSCARMQMIWWWGQVSAGEWAVAATKPAVAIS